MTTRTAKADGVSVLNYALVGFKEESGFRIFGFESISSDYSRDGFRVKIDLALSRKYGIRIQDLPLLCRSVLERRDVTVEQEMFTYAEADMRRYAEDGALRDASALRKRSMPMPLRTSAVAVRENEALRESAAVRENSTAAGWNLPQI